jgi:tetratricopeptide (TPR) repeat protein/tRNA A-37 threonylcarbamoyl transferase component Bud32
VLIGHVISHYRILEETGREYDAVIYRARDLRLDRDVAVKVLSGEKAAHARERFKREARIASLVSHPHIRAVHDSGEEDGHAFLVCELLEGRPLDEAVAAGPFPPERLLDTGIQLLDALAAMHARGLIHGNIRPSNVFLTKDGHVKLLEVGLMTALWEESAADKAADDSAPTVSVDRRAVPSTDAESFHPYRSPEQISGERLDHRTDLFSAGAVLYDMATAHRAFAGDTPADLAAAIVSSRHVPVTQRRPLMPEAIAAVIERALEKGPDSRYQTAAAMITDLRRARRRLESTATGVAVRRTRYGRRWAIAAAAVIVVAAAAALVKWGPWRTEPTRHAVLVGSIANGTNDPDFDGTLRQALTVHLSQSPFLDIVSDERLREILRMMGRETEAPLTHQVAREACQRLGLNAMVEGSVSAVGPTTIVALVATDCTTGQTVSRNQAEVQQKEQVLRAVGSLASSIRWSLGESDSSVAQHNVPIEEATTPSLEALKAYTAGVSRRAAGNELESIKYFETAIKLDPGFALAYTTLSSLYGSLGETGRGEEYARRAFEHRESVSERERLFITYQYHDRVTGDQLKAREALDVWKQSYPRDYRPPNALAVLLNRFGEYDLAIAEAEEAIRRNPSHSFPYSNLAYAFRGAGRYDEAKRVADKSVEMQIETLPTRRLMYQLAELDNDAARAQAQLDWARPRTQGFDLTGAHAQVLAFRGQLVAAREAYDSTVTLAARNGFAQISSGYASLAALTEVLYGNNANAIERTKTVEVDLTYAPRLRVAATLALAGAVGQAEAEVRRFKDVRPEDTMLHGVYMPIAEAAINLARVRYADVVETLRRCVPYERGFVAALMPMYLRGEARLRSGAYPQAIEEFRGVLEYRGADPFSPVIPLAQLGLARALERTGDKAGSASAYRELLQMWSHADDSPAVRAARAEAAALTQR